MVARQSRSKPKPRHRGASLRVQQHLLANFTPGSWLPSETEIAESLGVTRYAVTRALNNLFSLSVVRREAGRGTIFLGQNHPAPDARSATVAFICPEFTTGLALGLVPFLEKKLGEFKMRLALRSTEHRGNLEMTRLCELASGGFAGAIITPDDSPGEREHLLALAKANYPLVMLDRPLPDIPASSVSTDHYHGAREVVAHLQSLGHRRIAHITYGGRFGQSHAVNLRLKGYQDQLADGGGKPVDPIIETVEIPSEITSPDFREDNLTSYIAAHKLLMRAEMPTAIFVVNDYLCQGVILAARNHGLSVPGQLSVAGFDNDPGARIHELQITTFAHPLEALADACCHAILRALRGHSSRPSQREIVGRLVEGNSTGPAATA